MPSPANLTTLRAANGQVLLAATRDLAALRRLPGGHLASLRQILPGLIEGHGVATAELATTWYDDIRPDSADTFRATPVWPDGDQGTRELIEWALRAGSTSDAFWSLLQGGALRRILNPGRETIMRNAIGDPRARGWARFGSGDSCDFCRMLIGRGDVYTANTAQFRAHDGCGCIAAPVFDEYRPDDYGDSMPRR